MVQQLNLVKRSKKKKRLLYCNSIPNIYENTARNLLSQKLYSLSFSHLKDGEQTQLSNITKNGSEVSINKDHCPGTQVEDASK